MNASVGTREQKSPGLTAFGSLRAEDEHWLSECFAPPPQFERAARQRSTIIFGAPGSGKTALYRELQARSQRADGRPARLLVEWRPAPLPPEAQPNLAWVKRQSAHVLDACAGSLAHHLAHYPGDYGGASEWLQARLTWFIRRFTQGDPALRLGALAEGTAEGAVIIRRILAAPVRQVLYEDAAPDLITAELVDALSALGLDSVWVMSDGLEGWAEADPDRLSDSLSAFLSTLSLFERSGLVYKLCVPASLEPALSYAGGMARRRVDSVHLRWDTAALHRLVERRLAFSADRETFALEQLCDAPGFPEWLEKVGGASPREWLDQLTALVKWYLKQSHSQPIDEATWKQLRREHPPRLYLDDVGRKVIVGGREVGLENVPVKAYDMLCYLYRRAGQVVTKAELYFLVYLGLDKTPRSPADEHYEGRKEYEGLVDTNIWRLRQAIEPDPSDPVLLVTKRGHGLVLHVRW
ncbi:MAG: winged helix-turn-helix domain-containing protein [Chloroflexota bacterium]|nr:winged helix-turn-helix domain-containing protein [Chloroflexota bacterium]